MPHKTLRLIVRICSALAVTAGLVTRTAAAPSRAEKTVWARHVIDDSSKGADGVRLADVNGDGLLDITTGWEEAGLTRVYLHPGVEDGATPWPAVTVGSSPSVEDAVLVDLDGDGLLDVVSSCEGKTNYHVVHWGPKNTDLTLVSSAWKSEIIPATRGLSSWMYALPLQVDGEHGIDLVVGSKNPDGMIGWLEAPVDPRNLAAWKFHPMRSSGWIMSLEARDVDEDGDMDVIASDRTGEHSAVIWLENPGDGVQDGPWAEHEIGAAGEEVMFLQMVDLDQDGREDVVVTVKPDEIHWLRRKAGPGVAWESIVIPVSLSDDWGIGRAKGVAAGDLDGDGVFDLVFSCESATPPLRGVVWLEGRADSSPGSWITRDLSGPVGIKFDRIELVDLDADGDLDVLTCEERHEGKGLGVIWYENPLGEDN